MEKREKVTGKTQRIRVETEDVQSVQAGNAGTADEVITAGIKDLMDVRGRLQLLRTWDAEFRSEDRFLLARAAALNLDKEMDKQTNVQIANQRRRLKMKRVHVPFEIRPDDLSEIGYEKLRQHLMNEYAKLSQEDRVLWLNNLEFIMTAQIRELNDKLAEIRRYSLRGHQRNFLLGGPSGSGKSTYLDWYTYRHSQAIQAVQAERNYVPVVKADAPKNNLTSRPLFERIIRECGKTYLKSDRDEDLLMKVIGYFQVCGVELLILDEIEHITNPDIRRRVLEISNLTTGVPIVCASCHPTRWIEGDTEVAGRWNDYFELKAYRGKELAQLLAYIELFLPFTQPSHLSRFSINLDTSDGSTKKSGKTPTAVDGPAKLIEEWSRGLFRHIMPLLWKASTMAIERGDPNITPTVLQTAMSSIRTSALSDNFTGLALKAS